jgi:hypothetical protein
MQGQLLRREHALPAPVCPLKTKVWGLPLYACTKPGSSWLAFCFIVAKLTA